MAAYIQNQTMLALLAWDPYLHDPKLPHRLRRVACPTLVVWGREDRLIPAAHAEAYASLIPGAEVSVIPECGHIPHEEAEDEFVRLVSSFLASC